MMSLETYRLDTASLSDPVTLNDWIITPQPLMSKALKYR
jgi:hypothetical protein